MDVKDGRDQLFRRDVLAGFAERPKRLSPKWFYDKTGSILFDRITELPEYYLTRAETDLLVQNADALLDAMGPDAVLVELGSGSSTKTRLLLDRAERIARYVPVDISSQHLLETAATLRARYHRMEITPVVADYSSDTAFTRAAATVGASSRAGRTTVFFPGSSIGNFEPEEAITFLTHAATLASNDGRVIVGVDIPKDRATLEAAYDDAAGVTAQFNKNLLVRMNGELGADFDLDAFAHAAPWQPEPSRIEMRLVSKRRQQVLVAGKHFDFDDGEHVVTEHCYKWSPERFVAMAARAGLAPVDVLFDRQKRVSMHVLAPR